MKSEGEERRGYRKKERKKERRTDFLSLLACTLANANRYGIS